MVIYILLFINIITMDANIFINLRFHRMLNHLSSMDIMKSK